MERQQSASRRAPCRSPGVWGTGRRAVAGPHPVERWRELLRVAEPQRGGVELGRHGTPPNSGAGWRSSVRLVGLVRGWPCCHRAHSRSMVAWAASWPGRPGRAGELKSRRRLPAHGHGQLESTEKPGRP